MRLKDKVIIVTGSTQGIGEAIARRVVTEGGQVVVHGLERELGEKVAASLGGRAGLVINDLAEAASAEQMVQAAVRAFGRIDGIVNNAAQPARATLEQTDAATFDRIFAINTRAPLLLIRSALPYLKASRGSVLNIGSVNAYCGASNLVAYSMSKGALTTMTRNLADALCYEQVRVNQVNPGWVLTENEKRVMIEGGLPEDWWRNPPKYAAPSGAILSPEHIATAAVYWLGDESRPISGSVVELEQYPIIGRNTVKEDEK